MYKDKIVPSISVGASAGENRISYILATRGQKVSVATTNPAALDGH